MNFLGHCFFSDPTPEALNGSLWPDFARRPEDPDLPEAFYQHFDRHQQIDRLTDHHPLLEPVRETLRPVFRKTAPVVVDMMLDHHLARHWSSFHSLSLAAFADRSYRQLQAFSARPHPEKMAKTLYWMQTHDWFVSYRQESGLRQALQGMSRRLKFDNPMVANADQAVTACHQHRDELNAFLAFLSEEL